MQRLDVLPSFFQKRNEEIDTHVQISSNIIFTHIDSGDSGSETKYFFELEPKNKKDRLGSPDGLLDLLDFGGGVFAFGHHEGELADLDQDVAQESGDLLHQGLRCDEGVVRLGPLFDEFLVLVELLQSVLVDAGDAVLLGLHAVGGRTDDRDAHPGLGCVRQSDLARESFVFFRVVVTQSDLQLHGLHEFTLLLLS